MKTTNNVRKATQKTLAIVTGMAILSLSVNAQPIFRLTNENHVNLAMAVNHTLNENFSIASSFSETNTAIYTAYLVPETEEALEVESWMTDANNFTAMEIVMNEANENLTPATEEALEVESWMTDDNYFTSTEIVMAEANENLKPATEEALEVESWMTDDNHFTSTEVSAATANTYLAPAIEETLLIEDWMLNESKFDGNNEKIDNWEKRAARVIVSETFKFTEIGREPAMSIENWMVNPKIWTK